MSPDPNTHRSVSLSVVVMLPLLLIPLVISGFFLVYTLFALLLEGDLLALWRNESWSVAWPTAAIQIGFCACTIAFTRWLQLPWNHLLNWSSLIHVALVLALATIVYNLTFT
jgi:hypothetical protein